MISRLQNMPKRFLDYIESETIPLIQFVASFIAIILLRDFFESFSQASTNYLNLNPEKFMLNLIHFALGFATIAAALTLLLFAATKEKISKILRVVAVGFSLILISPPLDLIFSFGHGKDMFYLGMLASENNLLNLFFTFYKNYPGVTIGIKIELVLAISLIFAYCLLKGRSIFFSFTYAFLSYLILFFFSAAPILIHSILSLFHLSYEFNSALMIRFYLMTLALLGIVILFYAQPKFFLEIYKDMRWLRILFYWLTFCFGAALAMLNAINYDLIFSKQADLFPINFLFCSISLVCVGLFSIIQNNIYDIEIDRITNPKRPLVTESISLNLYRKVGWIALGVAGIYALAAGYRALFLISVVTANYYLYSVPPLRLKKIMIISKFMIALNFIAALLLGYSLLADSIRYFPALLFPIYLFGFGICANFIDVKDKMGDKCVGIKTLANSMSPSYLKLFLMLSFLATYSSFYFLLAEHSSIFMLLLIASSGLQLYFLQQKTFNERSNLLVCNFSLTSFILILLLENIKIVV